MSFDFNLSVPENAKGKKKTSRICEVSGINLVPGNGFEPAKALAPEASASTNFATRAQ